MIYLLKMVIFHSYVKYPEAKSKKGALKTIAGASGWGKQW